MRTHCFSQSSIIDQIAYDDEAGTLRISFYQTGDYLYYDVPASLFEAFCRAPSAGTFFNARIKDHFRHLRNPGRKRFGPNG